MVLLPAAAAAIHNEIKAVNKNIPPPTIQTMDAMLADVVAMDEVVTRLEALDVRQGQIVELRFFGGLSVEEVAEVMQISTPTVKREWQSAKAWLHQELTRGAAE